MKYYTYPSVLTIAGFDGSGGAGIQADIKTISALGCYATSVLTALPVQNTQGVQSIYPIAGSAVKEQISSIFDDIFPDAVKIGMVHSVELVDIIAERLQHYTPVPVVFDPVMVATSGHKLIEDDTITAIVQKLFPLATLITPNMDEAAVLAGMRVLTLEDMHAAGQKIMKLGCRNLLLKGGHLTGTEIISLLFCGDGSVIPFSTKKIQTRNMHGSGCTLSSAIASFLAQRKPLPEAVALAQDYVHKAIYEAADVMIGKGNGPLNHFFDPKKLIKYELE